MEGVSESKGDVRKVAIRFPRALFAKFSRKIEGACLRRDAFLNRVLDIELAALESEVRIPNSERARNHVRQQLSAVPGREPVTLSIERAHLDRLEALCETKRIDQDAFFNRLILLLVTPQSLLQYWFFPTDWEAEFDKNGGGTCSSYIDFCPIADRVNPFFTIRWAIEELWPEGDYVETRVPASQEVSLAWHEYGGQRIHTKVLGLDGLQTGVSLEGFNCAFPDSYLPSAREADAKRVAEMFDFLDYHDKKDEK